MNETLKKYIEFDIKELEGTDFSTDDAGCTRYGLNTKYDGLSCEELQNMTIEQAIEIYYQKLSNKFEEIFNQTQSVKLALLYLDITNLQGPHAADVCLKFAMQGVSEEDQVNRMAFRRMNLLYLIGENNPNLSRYLNGWLNRSFKVYRYIYST